MLRGFKSRPRAQRCPLSFPHGPRWEQPAMGRVGRSSSARGQLRFQESQRAGDSLATELHFSFPKKKSLQMQSKALPRPSARRARGAATAAAPGSSRGRWVQTQRDKHGRAAAVFLLSYFARSYDTRTQYGKLQIKRACVHTVTSFSHYNPVQKYPAHAEQSPPPTAQRPR